jgi:hypothetical protein
MHAALIVQAGDCLPHFAAGELLDGLFQRRVLLPHNVT